MPSALRSVVTAPLLVALVLPLLAAGCASGPGDSVAGAAASPTPTSVPTPAAAPVSSPEDAAARVIATDPRFAGATMRLPDSVGLTKWWEWQALPDGNYKIDVTLGWGDCPSGCISHHTWSFIVGPDGSVTPKGDSGDAVPAS